MDFYDGIFAHRATCLMVDRNDIKVLNLILSGNSDDARETDPSKAETRKIGAHEEAVYVE